ncbi:MAG: NAD(P)-binding protein [Rickettsiales bacterium]|nr:NAD(P)-binding protein [Rickettsiales bacterium]
MDSKSIAIIGSGISGLSAAYFLSQKYRLKIFEKNNYLGGHSNTVFVDYNNKKIAVDTGFIVFNHQTYPNLKKFFELLKVDYEKSNMSFGVKIDNGLEYAGTNLNTVFAQRKNIFNWQFLMMLRDILRFNKKAEAILEKPFDANYSLKNLLDDLAVKKYFREFYLLPMSGAIWSCSTEIMLNYPAQSFVNFFKNHGLLTVENQPQWFTVSGGSIQYVKKIAAKIGADAISLENEVLQVLTTSENKVLIKTKNAEELFDYVLFATHGDQVLKILQNPSNIQKEVFSSFKYQNNLAILHHDSSLMPKCKKAWASWVYSRNDKNSDDKIAVTYWMNNLQNIDHNYPLFVTLNPTQEIAQEKIFAQFNYSHPIFDSAAIKAQEKISALQGLNQIYFCGAYHKNGFHEDGISSALNAINKLDVFAPWQ